MADYITKESVHTMIRHLTKFAWRSPTWDERRVTVDTDDVHFGVDKIPAADVTPVVHGKWEHVANPNWPAHIHDKCSACGWWNTRNALCYDGRKGHGLNYCPNCGAKMKGVSELDG